MSLAGMGLYIRLLVNLNNYLCRLRGSVEQYCTNTTVNLVQCCKLRSVWALQTIVHTFGGATIRYYARF